MTGGRMIKIVVGTTMLGQNYNSPQEAWDKMLKSGRISQEQYNKYRNLI